MLTGTGNEKQAAAWRAGLTRQLFPQKALSGDDLAATKMRKKTTEDAIKKALKTLMEDFLRSVGPMMSSSNAPTNRINALEVILRDAAMISMQLWAQLRRFELIDLTNLPQRFREARRIMPDAIFVEANALHVKAIENNAQCMDEKQILFITSPGLVACGNMSGDDYSVRCVLKPAVAWLGRE